LFIILMVLKIILFLKKMKSHLFVRFLDEIWKTYFIQQKK
jgi:hypothetical protein